MEPNTKVCWHVSSVLNRESIQTHGLDWTRIGATGGVARGTVPSPGAGFEPEMPVVFLCDSWGAVEFFVTFGQHRLVDVWEADTDGLALEDGPDGWLISRSPIPAARLRLVRRDVPAPTTSQAVQPAHRVPARHDPATTHTPPERSAQSRAGPSQHPQRSVKPGQRGV